MGASQFCTAFTLNPSPHQGDYPHHGDYIYKGLVEADIGTHP
jgi:hypothetical protein